MKFWLSTALAGLSLLFIATPALAQKKAPREITLGEIRIVGRVQRPIAAVDVARIRPSITLSEVRRPFVERIEAATLREPF